MRTMRSSGRVIFRRVGVHGVVGFIIATTIAQLAGVYGTMGVVRANMERPERGIINHNGVPVAWMSCSDWGRRFVWWRRGLGLGEREHMRYGRTFGGNNGMYSHGSRLQGYLMFPQAPGPWWSRVNDPREVELVRQQDVGQWDDMRYDYAVGWPWPSYRYDEDRVPNFDGTDSIGVPRHGLHLASRTFNAAPNRPAFDISFLTWNPIWPGLIGSTAFWGVASFLFWSGLVSITRRWRVSRHQCTNCRYDLRGLPDGAPCPECGVERAPAQKPAAPVPDVPSP